MKQRGHLQETRKYAANTSPETRSGRGCPHKQKPVYLSIRLQKKIVVLGIVEWRENYRAVLVKLFQKAINVHH